jgi:hypothetical protein
MSSILKRPGWTNYQVVEEKVKIGDIERVIPGWGVGKEAKRYFAGKIGEEVPTGRFGALRKVGGTSYREAELAFSRYLAQSLEIAENVIATKEVKEILRGVTEDLLQDKGFDDVDDWLNQWVTYAQDNFGLDLTNVAVRRAVRAIAADAEDQIEQNDGAGGPAVELEAEPEIESKQEQELTQDVKQEIASIPMNVQFADQSEDGSMYESISFMGQQQGKITYIRLKDVPKDAQHKNALKNVDDGGSILDNNLLKNYVSQIEVEQNGSSTFYKTTAPAAPEAAPAAAVEPEDQGEDEFTFDLGESAKLNAKQQNILTEQMRIARKQHMQRIEERYLF